MTAPDRIIMDCGYTPNENGVALFASWNEPTEYVRADLVPPATLDVPEVKALVDAAKEVGRISDRDHIAWRRLSDALAALRGNGGDA